MADIPRREFIHNILKASSGAIFLDSNLQLFNSCSDVNRAPDILRVFIPMPVQVVIDDVGWWSGEDGSKRQEPYRTGINRNHVPADYQAIADLGRALGIRPQAAFVACEWDKDNILRELPTSTWMGDRWNNSKWAGPWLEEAAEIIRNNKDHLELSIHGVGHEYWEDDKFTRAEWTDSFGQMRPQDQVELHLEYFEKLLDQFNLGPLPVSFVPAAFRYSFGPSAGMNISLAEILKKYGVNYVNTPFSSIYNRGRIQYEYFGLDSKVITIDRGDDEFQWLVFPADPSRVLKGPTCGLHWPNMLHPEPERNTEAVTKWINYLKPYNKKPDMMLAPDSVYFQNQLVHNTLTKINPERKSIELDFTETDKLPGTVGKGELTIKIITDRPQQFRSYNIEIKKQSLQEGSEFLYVLDLERNPLEHKAKIKMN